MSDEKPKKQQTKKDAPHPAKEAKGKAPAGEKAAKASRPKEKVIARLSVTYKNEVIPRS